MPAQPFMAMFTSGFFGTDYDPIQAAVFRWLPTGQDVWLHNPWGHDGKPMDPDQWFRRKRVGVRPGLPAWKMAVQEERWEAASALLRYHGRKLYVHIGGPLLIKWNQWSWLGDWTLWLASQVDGLCFDSSEEVEIETPALRLLENVAKRCQVIIEPLPQANRPHLWGYGAACTQSFWNDRFRPAGKWALPPDQITGNMYRLLTHAPDNLDARLDWIARALQDCEKLGHRPVLPVPYLRNLEIS